MSPKSMMMKKSAKSATKKAPKKKGAKKGAKMGASSGFKAVMAPYSTQSAVVPLASKSMGTPVVYY